MIRVMIIDDELLVRLGLKNGIHWNSLGYEVIGEAADGREALNMIVQKQPELVFLDIGMPEMDGLELMEELNRRGIRSKIIVLSCHDEFHYVKEAMKLGALDYVLKLSLKPKELEGLLMDLKESWGGSDASNTGTGSGGPDGNPFPIELVVSGSGVNLQELGITQPEGEKYTLMLIGDEDGKSNPEPHCSLIREVVNEVVKDHCKASVAADAGHNAVILLQTMPGKDLTHGMAFNIAHRIHHSLLLCLNRSFMIGVSEVLEDLQQAMQAYEQAVFAQSFHFYCRFNGETPVKIYGYWHIRPNGHPDAYLSPERIKRLETAAAAGLQEEAKAEVCGFFREIRENEDLHPEKIKSLTIEILHIFSRWFREADNELEGLVGKDSSVYKMILETWNIDQLEGSVQSFLDIFFMYRQNQRKNRFHSEYILKIREYVMNNYRENISLSDAARYLSLNESYFSYLFKKETGQNFIEFLNRVRMEKACELLKNTDMKIWEVARETGYENVSYFSRLFKKVMGVNPNDIRNT